MRFRFPYTFFKRKAKNGKNIYYFRVWNDTRHVRVPKNSRLDFSNRLCSISFIYYGI